MEKEIKKETNWLGRERTFVYEDGEKVAEITKETGWFSSKEVEVTRDMSGEKIAVTSEETKGIIFPEKVQVTRDPQGRKLSETRHRNESLFRDSAEEIYEGREKIGELKRENTLKEIIFGSRRQILEESPGKNVDLTRRISREESCESPKSINYDNCYGEEEPYEPPKPTREQEYTEKFVEIEEGEFMKVVDKRAPVSIDSEKYLSGQEYKRIKKRMRLHYSLGLVNLTLISATAAYVEIAAYVGSTPGGVERLAEILPNSNFGFLCVLGGVFLVNFVGACHNLPKAYKLKRELKQLKKPNSP